MTLPEAERSSRAEPWGGSGAQSVSLTLRREPFEFGILPASYLLPQIETPSGLVPIQQKLLAAAAQSQSRRDGRPSVTKEDIAQCLELPFATARVVIDTLISTLPEESTFLNVDGEDLLENGEETKTVLVTDLLLFLFVQTFTRPRAQSQLRESAGAEFFFATATDGTDSGWSDDEYGTGAHFSFGSPSASPARRRKKANEANASPGGSPRGDCLSATESSAASLHSLFVVHHFNTVCGLVVGDSSKIGTGGIRGGLTELTANEVDALGYLFRGHGETETDFKKTEKLSVLSGLFTGAGLVHELAATVPATALRNWVSSELVGGRMRASESATPTLARHSVSPKRTGAHGSGSGTSNSNQPKHDVSNHVIENVRKGTVVRRARDFSQKTSVRVADCEDTVVYLLAPAQHVSIVGCTDCVMVVGAAQRAVRVERCRGVTVIAATKRLRARNARECVFHLAVAEPIVFMGECGGSVVAPYNTFYNDLEKHLVMSNLETGGCTKWNELVEIPGGGGEESARDGDDAKKKNKTAVQRMPPECFAPFIVPFRGEASDTDESRNTSNTSTTDDSRNTSVNAQITQANPFFVPDEYVAALDLKVKAVASLRKSLRDADLDDATKKELQATIQSYFKEWLSSSGAMRQVYELARIERG